MVRRAVVGTARTECKVQGQRKKTTVGRNSEKALNDWQWRRNYSVGWCQEGN